MKLGSFRGVAVLGLFTVAIATSTSALAPSGDGLGTANGPDGGTNNNKYHDADAPDESLLEQMAATPDADNGESKDEEKKDVIYPARTTRQRGNTEGELLMVESEEEEKQNSSLDVIAEELVETSFRLSNLGANLRGTPGLSLGEDPHVLLVETTEMLEDLRLAAVDQVYALEAFEDHYEKDPSGSLVALTKAKAVSPLPLTSEEVGAIAPPLERMDNFGETSSTNELMPDLIQDGVEGAHSLVEVLEDVQEALRIPMEIESERQLKDVVRGSKLFDSLYKVNDADDEEDEDISSVPTGSPIHFGTNDGSEPVHDEFESFNYASPRIKMQGINERQMFKDFRHKLMRKLSRDLHGKKGYKERKGRHLRRVESNGFCPKKCSHDDDACRCEKLAKCALDLSSYDLAVMFGKDRISADDYDDEKHGVFDSEEIQLFSAGDGLPRKASQIKSKARELQQSGDYSDSQACGDLLSEFYTLDSMEDESHQLSVEQVCDSVDSFTKLRMSEIVNHYDRAEEIAGPFTDEKKDLITDWYDNLDIPVSPWPGTGLKEYKDVVFKLNNNDGNQRLFLKTEQHDWPGDECGSEGGPVKFAEWDGNAPDRYKWRVYFDSARNAFQIRSEHCAIYADEHYWREKWEHFNIAAGSSWNVDQQLRLYTVDSMRSNQNRLWFRAENKNGIRLRLAANNKHVSEEGRSLWLKSKNSLTMFPGLAGSYAFTCAFSTATDQYDAGKEDKCNHHYLAENWDWSKKQGFYHPMADLICKAVYNECRAKLKEHMVELQSQWGESVGYNRGPLQPNVAWFRSGTFDLVSKTWPNYIFGGIGATLSGTGLSEVTESWHGANKEVTALKGTTSDSINFGDVLRNQFTICSVTRYTGGAFGRILNGEGADWLHGHHGWSNGGKAGVAHYQGWKTKSDGTNVNPITDWVVMCGTNAGSQLKLVNGVSKGTADDGQGGVSLWVNGRGNYGESSDFAIAEVMVWDGGLTSEEMYSASNYLVKKFGVGTVTEVSTVAPTYASQAEIPNSVQCNSVSYKACSEFAVALDEIYQHRDNETYPLENPMLKDAGVKLSRAMSGNDVLGQIQFPNAVVLRQDNSSGIKTFSKYKIRHFENFPGDEEVNKGPWRYKAGDKFRYDYSVNLGCTASHNEGNKSAVAMQACDKSINILAGRSTSIGVLSAIAKELKSSNGTEGMPGHCCLDNALDSEHFGLHYSPFINSKGELIPMTCNNPGHFHLGISREACEAANGKWFRSPCRLLEHCIDNRPKLGEPGFIQSFEDRVRGEPRKEFLSKLRIEATMLDLFCAIPKNCPVITISELEVRDGDGFMIPATNWAQKSTEGAFTADKAVNGNFADYSKTDIADPGAHILIDFGDAISFSQLKIYMPEGSRLPESTIQLLDESDEEEDDVVVGSLLIDGPSKEPGIVDVGGVNYALYTFNAEDFKYTRNFYDGGYVIEDPNDEDQCETARTELGFAADHPHDTEVCDEFVDQMCDEEPPIEEDPRRLLGEQSSSSHAQSNSARRKLSSCTPEKDSARGDLWKKICDPHQDGGLQWLIIAYSVVLEFLNYKKAIHEKVSTWEVQKITDGCTLLPPFLKGPCYFLAWGFQAANHVVSLVLITTIHIIQIVVTHFQSDIEKRGPAQALNDNAPKRDEMMYENFKVLWDKLEDIGKATTGCPPASPDGRKLETISVGPNLEIDKFEAVMTEKVSAEVTTVIEAQQSENKARMAEMKAELKAQQTESNQKLNALEAMVAQLIEQNRQLLDSIVGAGEKEE
mmetsp:Transcript_27236/g.62083  ORF Transcript_27236/g.62083 Transcript_27236/m.62083 type:complete len:1765 (-) Transcript_27236:163-5457(-)